MNRNRENQNQETTDRNAGKKKLSFLLPAALSALLVFDMLPQTQAVLREIPERLALVEEVSAQTPEAEGPKLKKKEKKEEDTAPQAVGNFTDGVFRGTSQGYGGPINVEVTVEGGQITDIKILSASGETEPYFSLARSILDVVKQKQSFEVDVISGATYSSRGILGAIKNALTGETVQNEAPKKVEPAGTKKQDAFKEPAAYKDGTYYGTAQGFGGSIKVQVTIKNGKISDIRVVSASGETGSYLSRAKSVIGRILSKGSPNVDTVSGATYSSTGIINAVKRALTQAASDGTAAEEPVEQKPAPKPPKSQKASKKQDQYTDASEYYDGVYYGTAEGFGGEIKVKVTIAKGKLKAVEIVSAKDETAEYLNKAKAVIKSMLKKGSPNVDTVSGATYSSTGIINAVKRAMKKAAKKQTGQETDPGTEQDQTPDPVTPVPDPDVTPEETLRDGVYTGTGTGYGGDIVVQVTVSEGKITGIEVVSQDETPRYYNNALSLIPEIITNQSADVDVVSGATYSSNGIIGAVKEAVARAAEAEDDPSGEDPGSGDDPSGEDPGTGDDPTGGHTGGGAEGGSGTDSGIVYRDGTYSKTGMCTDADVGVEYEVTAAVKVEGGVIKSVDVSFGEDYSDDPEENDWYISRALGGTSSRKGIPAQIVEKQSAEVDAVSQATRTSETIKSLVRSILSDIIVKTENDPEEAEEAAGADAAALAGGNVTGAEKSAAETAGTAADGKKKLKSGTTDEKGPSGKKDSEKEKAAGQNILDAGKKASEEKEKEAEKKAAEEKEKETEAKAAEEKGKEAEAKAAEEKEKEAEEKAAEEKKREEEKRAEEEKIEVAPPAMAAPPDRSDKPERDENAGDQK